MDKNDEFSGFFINGQQPKILITTTCRPGLKAQEFAKELSDFFPNAEYKQRTLNTPVPDVVKGATIRNYTHLVLVNESRKQFGKISLLLFLGNYNFKMIRNFEYSKTSRRSNCHLSTYLSEAWQANP